MGQAPIITLWKGVSQPLAMTDTDMGQTMTGTNNAVKAGRLVTLTCKSSNSFPKAKIMWVFKDQQISQNDITGSLIFFIIINLNITYKINKISLILHLFLFSFFDELLRNIKCYFLPLNSVNNCKFYFFFLVII